MSAETIPTQLSPVEQTLLKKLRLLPIEKQNEVLDFTEFLGHRAKPETPRESLEGLWQGLHDTPVTEEDIAEARREMWGAFPREDML